MMETASGGRVRAILAVEPASLVFNVIERSPGYPAQRRPKVGLGRYSIRLHAEPDALQIDRDHAVKGFFGPLRGLLARGVDLMGGDGGVVEGAVEPAIGRDRVADHGADILGAGYIAGQCDRL